MISTVVVMLSTAIGKISTVLVVVNMCTIVVIITTIAAMFTVDSESTEWSNFKNDGTKKIVIFSSGPKLHVNSYIS